MRILEWVQGYRIPFDSPPFQTWSDFVERFSPKEYSVLEELLPQLVCKGAIVPCSPVNGQFVSPIFLEPKASGGFRLILNLKRLNAFITPQHFKQEDYRTACRLVSPSCFMAKLDLKDAYYLVSVHPEFRKYLRFRFRDMLYEFTCLPFGLCTAPYTFTKLLRPVIASFRKKGLKSVIFLDDFLLIGNSREDCVRNVEITCTSLFRLGFLFSPDKCQFPPTTSCCYLGFTFDSVAMTLSVPTKKEIALKSLVARMRKKASCSIREFARFLGSLSACCPAIPYSWAYTKQFERDKYLALLCNNNNYDALMTLYPRTVEFDWWESHLGCSSMPLRPTPFVREIFSDASLTGWGAECQGQSTRGFWSETERSFHINLLELLAALFSLKSFSKDLYDARVLLRLDNTTAISYINRMGGVQFPHLNAVALDIWQYCESKKLIVFASYIRSADNSIADAESRAKGEETEYELSQEAFREIVFTLGHPVVDLFASRLNAKCARFYSWKGDPEAERVDAFTVPWTEDFFYAFPPFSIILRTLQKIAEEGAEGILVVPLWPSQPWYPLFMDLLSSPPLILQPSIHLLCSPSRNPHPLWRNLSLAAGKLSGRHFKDGTSRLPQRQSLPLPSRILRKRPILRH